MHASASSGETALAGARGRGVFGRVRDRLAAYLALTKPTIVLLVVLTGAAGAVLDGGLLADPLRFAASLLLLAMAAGSANAFNQFFERRVDAVMARTRARRPLPAGRIHAWEAFVFASLLAAGSTVAFALSYNWLTALLSLGTILFYALFYTLYLKPRTRENIVIGGAAGAMGPVILTAAGDGAIGTPALLMFAVIFFWTPPHFWSLAIYMKHDYVAVNYPMMPVVAGERATWTRNIIYTALAVAASLALLGFGLGWLYGIAAVTLGAWFLRRVVHGAREHTPLAARNVFLASIVYLLALFTAAIADAVLPFTAL
ncbi:MAG: Protoheme IX farnesyltransferase [Calditrichaeota bacterium]|nr:Protoheme IX farnesyltransferase [Calditrichota bacterium]